MLFNSAKFLLFFPIVVLGYFVLPKRIKNLYLLLASYFFYMCWSARYALLLLFSTFITYAGGLILEKIKKTDLPRKSFYYRITLIVAVGLNLFILFYFKYSNFILGLMRAVAFRLHIDLHIPVIDVILPVGISFYIFQALGYLIDVYRGDIYAEKNFLQYALFVSFFPQLVAGPIERSKNLLKQLADTKKFNYENVRQGLLIMLWGYFLKMVIADRSAILVNAVYAKYLEYKGFQLITANILFAIQIYCDFMGYSTIAKGAAKVLGFDLMENFHEPYFACSIKDFWRRWHISLSTWFRDYLYIPLGGSRCSTWKKYRNIMITFVVSGLWHGASLTFVFWGFIHGAYQLLEDFIAPYAERIITKLKINTTVFSWKLLRIVKTFILIDIAWIFFRADKISSAFFILKKSLDLDNIGLILNDGLYQLGLDTKNMNILLFSILILALVSYMKEKGKNLYSWLSSQNLVFRYAVYWGAVVLILFSLDITGQEFIYFQF